MIVRKIGSQSLWRGTRFKTRGRVRMVTRRGHCVVPDRGHKVTWHRIWHLWSQLQTIIPYFAVIVPVLRPGPTSITMRFHRAADQGSSSKMRWRLRVMQEQCWDTIDRKLGKLKKNLYSMKPCQIHNFLYRFTVLIYCSNLTFGLVCIWLLNVNT